MKDKILKEVKDFIQEYWVEGRPILLGFSGGPDSLALLYLLIECKRFFNLDLHLVHVDHGWRKESAQEAKCLRALAKELALPFHCKTLQPRALKNNLEDEGRKARLQVFSQLYRALDCQGILLAHHADDQAETVLKRIFEGSSLLSLGGLKKNFYLEGMQIFRPLLRVRKKDLVEWIDQRGLRGMDDPTNKDPFFLRARMRVEIFPYLNNSFGKEIVPNLVHLGEISQELKDYLQRKIAPLLQSIIRGKEEIFIDLLPFLPLEKIEFLAFFKTIAEEESCFFSKAILENLYRAVHEGKDCRFFQSGRELLVKGGALRILLGVKNLEN